MNLYIEYNNFFSFSKRISRVCKEFEHGNNPVFLTIIFSGPVLSITLIRMLLHRKVHVGRIEFEIPDRFLTAHIIKSIDKTNRTTLCVRVEHNLTDKNKNALSDTQNVVKVKDLTESEDNRIFYDQTRNILASCSGKDEILNADIAHLTNSQLPIFQCHFSSCLGKTLYISRDGTISFCAENPGKTVLGSINDSKPLSELFNNPVFEQMLYKSIEHRRFCKSSCGFFTKCKGGCAMIDECQLFKDVTSQFINKRNEVINAKSSLSVLKMSEEYEILSFLLKKSNPVNTVKTDV